MLLRLVQAAARRSSARVLRNNQDQVGRAPSGGAHWDPFNTQQAAVRQHQPAQGRRSPTRTASRSARSTAARRSARSSRATSRRASRATRSRAARRASTDLDFMQCADGGCPDVAKKYMDLAEKDGADVSGGKYTGPPSHARRQQHAGRQDGGRGHGRPDGGARVRGQDPPGRAGHALHEVPRRAQAAAGVRRRRGLGEGLPGRPDPAVADLPVGHDQGCRQRELVAAQVRRGGPGASRRRRASRPARSATRRSRPPTRRSRSRPRRCPPCGTTTSSSRPRTSRPS